MGITLLRTDKNGTKYYEDTRCPKCDGTGYIECYAYHEAGRCFLCGGSGFYLTHFKEMTPEYAAQLEAQRQAREERKKEKFNAGIAEHYKALGLNAKGNCFAVLDQTWNRKDELKEQGARFNGAWWYFAEPKEGWDTAEVDAKKFIWNDIKNGCVRWNEDNKYELRQEIQSVLKQRRTEANSAAGSEFYGSVGDKVDLQVEIKDIFSFECIGYNGEDCTMYVYKMEDGSGHHFVWITGSKPPKGLHAELTGEEIVLSEAENGDFWTAYENEAKRRLKGMRVSVKGTIKEQKEREGQKQTILTRCRFKKA